MHACMYVWMDGWMDVWMDVWIHVCMYVCIDGRKCLFNDALNTYYLRLYDVIHMVKNHSDSERRNPLPPHGLLFPISSKGYFICIIPQTG